MKQRKQLAQELRTKRAIYKQSKDVDARTDAYKILAELGRSTKQLKRESDAQQLKLFTDEQ
jgi:hypothetical protein